MKVLQDFYSEKSWILCNSSEKVINHFIQIIDSQHPNFHILIRQIYYILRYSDINDEVWDELWETLDNMAFDQNYSKFKEEIKRINRAMRYRSSYNKKRSKVEEVWKRIMQEKSQKLEMKSKILEEEALIDPLTGIWNRRVFVTDSEKLLSRVHRDQVKDQAILCMIDLDYFKSVNDSFGHQKWDEVLKAVVEILKNKLRSTDTIYRFWWEEFIILAECKKSSLPKWVDKMTKTIQEELNIHSSVRLEKQITISVWVSLLRKNSTIDKAINEADQALYYKKENWRNWVCIYNKEMIDEYQSLKDIKQAIGG